MVSTPQKQCCTFLLGVKNQGPWGSVTAGKDIPHVPGDCRPAMLMPVPGSKSRGDLDGNQEQVCSLYVISPFRAETQLVTGHSFLPSGPMLSSVCMHSQHIAQLLSQWVCMCFWLPDGLCVWLRLFGPWMDYSTPQNTAKSSWYLTFNLMLGNAEPEKYNPWKMKGPKRWEHKENETWRWIGSTKGNNAGDLGTCSEICMA